MKHGAVYYLRAILADTLLDLAHRVAPPGDIKDDIALALAPYFAEQVRKDQPQ